MQGVDMALMLSASDSAMFESHPVNPSRQLLLEELAVAGVNIEQVKEILF